MEFFLTSGLRAMEKLRPSMRDPAMLDKMRDATKKFVRSDLFRDSELMKKFEGFE